MYDRLVLKILWFIWGYDLYPCEEEKEQRPLKQHQKRR
jgi:hypothetical protein